MLPQWILDRLRPDDPRLCQADPAIQDGIRSKYDYQCALCPYWPEYKVDHPLYRIIPDTLKGRSEHEWLTFAGLPMIDIDSEDNCIPLCDGHGDNYDEGIYMLCPPLVRDLELLEEWEVRDWRERVQAASPRDRYLPPPEALSGRLAIVWITSVQSMYGSVCSRRFSAQGWSQDTFPPQLHMISEPYRSHFVHTREPFLPTEFLPERGLEVLFNASGVPWRVNPYAILVKAMNLTVPAYIPMKISASRYNLDEKIVHMSNSIETYRNLLFSLIKL
ncbi:hypothetical protein C8T65DRAFT_637953 [Cerioporus squamosus]|nr:hypothetical protein C8T65DRAFT_637953 [Cerioporus squamosus]